MNKTPEMCKFYRVINVIPNRGHERTTPRDAIPTRICNSSVTRRICVCINKSFKGGANKCPGFELK